MREIKFRAWDNKEKRWCSDFSISNIGSFMRLGISQRTDDIIIQQFTGLLDKNGKEIYEGDIIKIPDDWDEYGMNAGEVYEIFFNEGGFRLKPKYRKGARGIWLEDTEKLEVIGNIFENPELITN